MNRIRRQLTLFINEPNGNIEKVRAEFNPEQFNLISAHVTLCTQDEIEPIEKIIRQIKSITLDKPVRIEFDVVEKFAEGKGVLIPAKKKNPEFIELRKSVLGLSELVKEQFPHVTLMHPRNSSCTDEIFEKIEKRDFPTELNFDTVSLIEQKNGGIWKVLEEFKIVK
jgi:2'-5' RNA ligase